MRQTKSVTTATSSMCSDHAPFTTRFLKIYDISRVTFNIGIIDLIYLWWYIKFCHRILVGPRAYQNGWHFYDDSSIYHHKLKWEIVTDPLVSYDETSIITIQKVIVTDWLHLPWHFCFAIVWRQQNGPNCR
jgi:hypothetical protein